MQGWGRCGIGELPDYNLSRSLARHASAAREASDAFLGEGTLELALRASGLEQANVAHKPRLLSDNGPSYISGDLAEWLDDRNMKHTRGAPYHPISQGKMERWHQTLKNRTLLENYFLPGDLETRINAFVEHYNHHRYHENIGNLTPADVYFGRGQIILLKREKISNGIGGIS